MLLKTVRVRKCYFIRANFEGQFELYFVNTCKLHRSYRCKLDLYVVFIYHRLQFYGLCLLISSNSEQTSEIMTYRELVGRHDTTGQHNQRINVDVHISMYAMGFFTRSLPPPSLDGTTIVSNPRPQCSSN